MGTVTELLEAIDKLTLRTFWCDHPQSEVAKRFDDHRTRKSTRRFLKIYERRRQTVAQQVRQQRRPSIHQRLSPFEFESELMSYDDHVSALFGPGLHTFDKDEDTLEEWREPLEAIAADIFRRRKSLSWARAGRWSSSLAHSIILPGAIIVGSTGLLELASRLSPTIERLNIALIPSVQIGLQILPGGILLFVVGLIGISQYGRHVVDMGVESDGN